MTLQMVARYTDGQWHVRTPEGEGRGETLDDAMLNLEDDYGPPECYRCGGSGGGYDVARCPVCYGRGTP